jgi:hypothetical protein
MAIVQYSSSKKPVNPFTRLIRCILKSFNPDSGNPEKGIPGFSGKDSNATIRFSAEFGYLHGDV